VSTVTGVIPVVNENTEETCDSSSSTQNIVITDLTGLNNQVTKLVTSEESNSNEEVKLEKQPSMLVKFTFAQNTDEDVVSTG
jgi:hypothetical protein